MSWFKTSFLNSSQLPLVIEPTYKNLGLQECLDNIKQDNSLLKKHLLTNGGLLFRGFPINSANDFTLFIKALDTGKFLDYVGGDSPRIKVSEGVYTSTEAPPSIKIPLHNELSYVKNSPSHIFFYCEIPPKEKGETIIADARKVFASIDKDVKEKFIQKNLRYTSCYYPKDALMKKINRFHKSWIDVFETENKTEVEKKCQENEFNYVWLKNDWLELSQIRPAITKHPLTHETVWFNQAHIFDFNPKFLGWLKYLGTKLLYCLPHTKLHEIHYADGSNIDRKDIYHIMDKLDENTIYFPWQKGDVLVLDNVLAMHGRAPFSGKRRVLVSMTGS